MITAPGPHGHPAWPSSMRRRVIASWPTMHFGVGPQEDLDAMPGPLGDPTWLIASGESQVRLKRYANLATNRRKATYQVMEPVLLRVVIMIQVVVRDGRIGRGPSRVTAEGGEVLTSFESERPFDEGDRLTLPDGTTVCVIGSTEEVSPTSWRQVVYVGDDFDLPADLPPVPPEPFKITVPMAAKFRNAYARDQVIGSPLKLTVKDRVMIGVVVDWIDEDHSGVTLVVEGPL
jgi:hypothetical protein